MSTDETHSGIAAPWQLDPAVLAAARAAAQPITGFGEPAQPAYNNDFLAAYAGGLAGPVLAADNGPREQAAETDITNALILLEGALLRSDLDAQTRRELEGLRSQLRSGGRDRDLVTQITNVVSQSATRNVSDDGAEHALERKRQELNRMADAWFGKDTEERKKFDGLVDTAINSTDEEEAAKARKQAAEMARDSAGSDKEEGNRRAEVVTDYIDDSYKHNKQQSIQKTNRFSIASTVIEENPDKPASEPENSPTSPTTITGGVTADMRGFGELPLDPTMPKLASGPDTGTVTKL